MLIRPALSQDIPGVVAVHVAAWDAAKEGLDLPSRRSVEDRTRQWTTFLDEGIGALWVMEQRGGVGGFVAFGPSRDDDRAGETEVYTVYVDPDLWSAGIGSALMEQVPSGEVASLWVSESNARARAFYEHHGFRPDGAREEGHHVPVIRVVRSASTAERVDPRMAHHETNVGSSIRPLSSE